MRFSSKLSLACLTLTLAAPALSSNVAQVEIDLTAIQSATTSLGNTVQSWAGDAASLPTVSAAVDNVATIIHTAMRDTKESYPFFEADAKVVIGQLNDAVPILNQTISALISKIPTFRSVGALNTVENSLQTLQINSGQLTAAVQANTPDDLVSQVVSLQAQLSGIIYNGIQAFAVDS